MNAHNAVTAHMLSSDDLLVGKILSRFASLVARFTADAYSCCFILCLGPLLLLCCVRYALLGPSS